MSKKSRALKIDTDGTITEVQISLTSQDMNVEMFGPQRLVERVSPVGLEGWNALRPDGAKRAIMAVDESGLYHPDYNENLIASILYGFLEHNQVIKGPVFLVCEGREGWIGLHESFTEQTVIDLVENFIPFDMVKLAISAIH